jgi:hypothetical protein
MYPYPFWLKHISLTYILSLFIVPSRMRWWPAGASCPRQITILDELLKFDENIKIGIPSVKDEHINISMTPDKNDTHTLTCMAAMHDNNKHDDGDSSKSSAETFANPDKNDTHKSICMAPPQDNDKHGNSDSCKYSNENFVNPDTNDTHKSTCMDPRHNNDKHDDSDSSKYSNENLTTAEDFVRFHAMVALSLKRSREKCQEDVKKVVESISNLGEPTHRKAVPERA